jgi:hypothetical protein
MTTTINASTSSGLVVTPDNSGNVLLQYNGIAAPMFRGALATNLTVPTGTLTQISFNTKQFDTATAYSSGVFTVPVTGYYYVNAFIAWSGDITGQWYFNWSITGGNPVYTNAIEIDTATGSGTNHGLGGSDLLYLTAGQSLTSYIGQSTGSTKYVTAGGETFANIAFLRGA